MARAALVSTPIVRSAIPVRLGTIPYQRVKLNAFLLAGILHLSHPQFARVVRHNFATFFGIRSLLGLEYLEDFWRFRLEP